MKKRSWIIIAGVVVFAGFLFFIMKTGLLSNVYKSRPIVTNRQQPASGHEGHESSVKDNKSGGAVSDNQAATEEEAATVEIPEDKQQLIGVKTVIASVKPLSKVIRTVGRIEYDERGLSTVNTKLEGWIEKLYVDYTGRYVKKGEPLAEIYSPELMATQQEFLNVLKWSSVKADNSLGKMLSRDAEAIVDGARQRLRLRDITDAQIKKIEETGKPIRTFTIYSPSSGYVIQKTALLGMRVNPGEKLFDVADISTIWVVSDIYEYELPLIKVGQTAKISLSYFPGRDFTSRIDYVYPALSGETRTAKVRFTISNPGGQLKPQMFTSVEVKIDLGKRLIVPDDAVIDTGARQIIYVDKGDGNFEPREVLVGLKADGMTEIIRGLKAGEKVASAANFLIDSEAQLKGVKPLGGHRH